MTVRAKVLFAIPELGNGGPDRVFFELISGLNLEKFEPVLAVSRTGGRYFERLSREVSVEILLDKRYPVLSFARMVDRIRPDIILTTLRMNLTATVARTFQLHRPPLIARQANAMGPDFKSLREGSFLKFTLAELIIRYLLKVPDALVAQSNDMALELLPHITKNQNLVTIGNPVSVCEIDDEVKRLLAATKWGEPAIVAVGRLAPQKGFDLLIDAFELLLKEFPLAKLTLLGEGPCRAGLEKRISRAGIGTSVRLLGESDCVFAEVAAADLFVSSSRYEGFSNAILEAMALGTPVVATNSVGATKEMIIDGVTGILVEDRDKASLYNGLLRGIRLDRQVTSRRARQHLISNFDKGQILKRYEQLFLDCIKSGYGSRDGSGLSAVNHASHEPSR